MGSIKQRGRKKQPKKRVRRNQSSVRGICLVLLLLCGVCGVGSISLKQKERVLLAQETELQGKIKEEKARTEEIKELKEYVGTDAYVEDVAREKLGLVHENEIVFKAE